MSDVIVETNPTNVVVETSQKDVVVEVNPLEVVVQPQTNDLVVETEQVEIVVKVDHKDVVVRPVNKDVVLLPRTTQISVNGDTANFALKGDTTVEFSDVALESIIACEVIVDTGSGFELADATNPNHFSLATGIALTTVLAGQTTISLIDGKIENSKWSWVVGNPLFIGTTPGQLVQTPDTGSYFVRLIGYALTPTLIHVNQHDGTIADGLI